MENTHYKKIVRERGKTQSIFLIQGHAENANNNANNNANALIHKYDVMGTTGNCYTVSIANTCSCTCPHYQTRNVRCKHIYFILTRVMQVSGEEEMIDYYPNEMLKKMFANIPDYAKVMSGNKTLADLYNKINDKQQNREAPKKTETVPDYLTRKVNKKDKCPICLDNFGDFDVVQCRYSCGNYVHAECFRMASEHHRRKRETITCIYCRQPWNKKPNAKDVKEDDYINLMSLLNLGNS